MSNEASSPKIEEKIEASHSNNKILIPLDNTGRRQTRNSQKLDSIEMEIEEHPKQETSRFKRANNEFIRKPKNQQESRPAAIERGNTQESVGNVWPPKRTTRQSANSSNVKVESVSHSIVNNNVRKKGHSGGGGHSFMEDHELNEFGSGYKGKLRRNVTQKVNYAEANYDFGSEQGVKDEEEENGVEFERFEQKIEEEPGMKIRLVHNKNADMMMIQDEREGRTTRSGLKVQTRSTRQRSNEENH